MIDGLRQTLRSLFSVRDNCWRRHAWVKAELAKIPAGARILDAGCGPQIYRDSCAHLEYRGQDFGEYDGKGSGEGIQSRDWKYGKLDYVGDVWNIEEKDESFDCILCTEVLEHIPYPAETIGEFSRLLKPGGTLLLTAPFSSLPHMEPYHYFSGFSKSFYLHFFDRYGMEVVSIDSNGNAFEYVAQEIVRSRQFVRNGAARMFYKLMVHGVVVPVLKALARADRESHRILFFGYHVKGRKK